MVMDITRDEILVNEQMVSRAFDDLFSKYAGQRPRLGTRGVAHFIWIEPPAAPVAGVHRVGTFYEYKDNAADSFQTEFVVPDKYSNRDPGIPVPPGDPVSVAPGDSLYIENEEDIGLKGKIFVPMVFKIPRSWFPAAMADAEIMDIIRNRLAIHVLTKKQSLDSDFRLRHIIQMGNVVPDADPATVFYVVLKSQAPIPLETTETYKMELWVYGRYIGGAGTSAAGGKLSSENIILGTFPAP